MGGSTISILFAVLVNLFHVMCGFAWLCKVLYGLMIWSCIVLSTPMLYCTFLYGPEWSCVVMCGPVRYCMVLHCHVHTVLCGPACWSYMVLYGSMVMYGFAWFMVCMVLD